MRDDGKIFDDLARVAGGALGALSGLREEAEQRLRRAFEEILTRMDLVRREEFEAVKAMAAKAREEQERLAERLAALETRLPASVEGEKAPSDEADSPSEGEPG